MLLKKEGSVCIFPMKNLSKKTLENTLIYFASKTLHTISPTNLYVFPENFRTEKKKNVFKWKNVWRFFYSNMLTDLLF